MPRSEQRVPEAAISGPTAPVPKDPQPSIDRIDELARRILSGDILLPKFQREFVWESHQILNLLDSVARGYPIGSVLLWQSTQELRSERKIADLDNELPRPGYPVNYLLDGQQRLSTICGAMYWGGTNVKSRWNIAYDLRQQVFVRLETLDDPPLHQIRINKLPDATIYFKHVASLDTLTSADKNELKLRAEVLFSRFKDYKIATVTLGDMSITDVAPVFERINSTGTPLTIVDLMRAATWSPEFDLIDSIEDILQELEAKDFGNIDKKVILRNLSAAAGGTFSADGIGGLRKFNATELAAAAAATKEAYKRAVDFLHANLGIPSAEIIPYSNQFTVLCEAFRLVPSPSAAQYRAIERWFWRTSLSGYFSGWNTGNMATDLQAVKAFASGASEIAVDVQPPSAETWKARTFRLNTAHAKLLGIVLGHQRPLDLLTGNPVDVAKALSWNNSKEYHHFFPQDFLKSKGEPPTRINSLCNIVMLSSASNKTISGRAPSDYLRDVAAAAGANLDAWLGSNLISRAAYDAACRDDFEAFRTHRAEAINGFIKEKAAW